MVNVQDYLDALNALQDDLRKRASKREPVPTVFGGEQISNEKYLITQISSFEKSKFRVYVYILDRTTNEENETTSGDLCEFIISNNTVYTYLEWDEKTGKGDAT